MPTNAATAARLIFVDDSLPGITRRRAGKGCRYFDPGGAAITDRAEIARLNAIALPPAYRDAWFCQSDNGHILATGIDDKGRKQYRYHPEFRAAREAEKFGGCIAFGAALPEIRKRVEAERARGHLQGAIDAVEQLRALLPDDRVAEHLSEPADVGAQRIDRVGLGALAEVCLCRSGRLVRRMRRIFVHAGINKAGMTMTGRGSAAFQRAVSHALGSMPQVVRQGLPRFH